MSVSVGIQKTYTNEYANWQRWKSPIYNNTLCAYPRKSKHKNATWYVDLNIFSKKGFLSLFFMPYSWRNGWGQPRASCNHQKNLAVAGQKSTGSDHPSWFRYDFYKQIAIYFCLLILIKLLITFCISGKELTTGKLTVGKIYGGLLILENWKTTRFGQIEPSASTVCC